MTSNRQKRPFPYVLVFTAIPVAANLIAVAASFALNDYVYLDEERAQFNAFAQQFPWALWIFNLLPFPTVIVWVYTYLAPVFTGLRNFAREQNLGEKAAARLLNAPLVISALGMGGWVFGTAIAIVLQAVYVRDLTAHVIWVTVTNALCLGGITFVFTYYALDYVNRSHVIPRYLASRNLSEITGVFRPSVTARFFIFYFSVAVLPVLVVSQMLARSVLAASGFLTLPVILFPVATLSVGVVLSWLLARAFERPLIEMKTAVLEIQQGSFNPQLAATSTDELGLLAEGINHMATGLREKEFMKETFGKVVAPAVRDHLLKGNLQLGGEMRTATVLFCDLRGFTSISEQLAPQQVVEMLNIHFDTMSRCIEEEGGLINKFIGDAIMAIYNVPLPYADHAARAYRSAMRMIASLAEMNAGFLSRGLPQLKIGIGLHTGEVLAGNIGSSSRLEYTVIGDTVNVASRIEGLCKETGKALLISEATVAEMQQNDPLEVLGEFPIRGREKPIRIYTTGKAG